MAKVNSYQLIGTGLLQIGSASHSNEQPGYAILQVVDLDSWTGSLELKGAIQGLEGTDLTANLTDLPYVNRSTGAQVAAGTPITAAGIYAVPLTGELLIADYTHTSGEGILYFRTEEGTLLVDAIGSGGGGGGDVTIVGPLGQDAMADSVPVVIASDQSPVVVTTSPGAATVGQVATNSATATSIVGANAGRETLFIANVDATDTIYLGTTSGVTSANGYPLTPGASVNLGLTNNEWFGISGAGTPAAGFIEV